jgi:hypothetical protein
MISKEDQRAIVSVLLEEYHLYHHEIIRIKMNRYGIDNFRLFQLDTDEGKKWRKWYKKSIDKQITSLKWICYQLSHLES